MIRDEQGQGTLGWAGIWKYGRHCELIELGCAGGVGSGGTCHGRRGGPGELRKGEGIARDARWTIKMPRPGACPI